MNTAGAFFARWRVRISYPLAILVLWFSRPTPRSLLWAASIGLLGLFLRARAAGHLHKQKVLTVTGPYAYTRNPLYLGSAILTLGASVASHSWLSAAFSALISRLFYSIVMRREEAELRQHHGAAFNEYARCRAFVFPASFSRKAFFRGRRLIFFCAVQEKPRIPGGDRIPAIACGIAVDLVVASALRRFSAVFSVHATKQLISSCFPSVKTCTAPSRSVRRMRISAVVSRSSSSGLGWPYGLSSPALITARRGMHGSQETRHRRVLAAVMTNLQHIRAQRRVAVVREYGSLRLFFCVSWQQ